MAASAMDLTCKLLMKLSGQAVQTGYEFGAPTLPINHSFDDSLTDGTGADKANQIWQVSSGMAGSASLTYDLAGGLTDEFGGTVTFTRIKAIFFKNTSVTAAVLQVGGGTGADGTNAFDTWITSTAADGSEGVLVRAGGAFVLWSPDATAYAVTGGSVDILLVKEKANAVALFTLSIVGEV